MKHKIHFVKNTPRTKVVNGHSSSLNSRSTNQGKKIAVKLLAYRDDRYYFYQGGKIRSIPICAFHQSFVAR